MLHIPGTVALYQPAAPRDAWSQDGEGTVPASPPRARPGQCRQFPGLVEGCQADIWHLLLRTALGLAVSVNPFWS